uniref:Calmodulin binding transcription activator 1a n=1 Tax=Sinocyclocheilus grahami TaxID=75366 RepID=A0A672MRY1_SINGR
MPWLATYLDTIDSRCPTPPSLLSDLALQRLRPPSSVAWAEFLNASANGRMERDFALLTLTDTEQRELYEAARIIQNAFRRYKGRRLKEQQDMAAAVIQRCYRKYKQDILYTSIARHYRGSFLTKKQDQAARKIMRFLRRCRHRYTSGLEFAFLH